VSSPGKEQTKELKVDSVKVLGECDSVSYFSDKIKKKLTLFYYSHTHFKRSAIQTNS
jgi:hypothetical protein